MIDLEYTEIHSLLYPNIQLDDVGACNDLGKYSNLRLKYLHKEKPQRYGELLFTGEMAQHPAPAEGMERIQTFVQAQMVADEVISTELIFL